MGADYLFPNLKKKKKTKVYREYIKSTIKERTEHKKKTDFLYRSASIYYSSVG